MDSLTLDDQLAKMIGPIPPSPFQHRKIEIKKLVQGGYQGYKKNIQGRVNFSREIFGQSISFR